jgi:transcriptional regulator with XRE-family HTH domain
MAKSFKILRDKMSLEAQIESKRKAEELLTEMRLNELRALKNLSQEQLAEILNTTQANVSRMERRTDMYVSTLESYIEALGGHLKIIASFPDHEIDLTNQLVGARS